MRRPHVGQQSRINPMDRIAPYQRLTCLRPHADRPVRPHVSSGAGTIGATKPTLVPATNKAAAQYTRQSVTTGLIGGSDLVIVLISGVIKKYK